MKKKTTIITACILVLLIGFTLTACTKDEPVTYESIMKRYETAESEDEIFDAMRKLSKEKLIQEMNVLLENGMDSEGLMYHAGILNEKVTAKDAEFILSETLNGKNHDDTRWVLSEVYGNILMTAPENADIPKLQKIILDENEYEKIRINAIYALPGNEETIAFLEDAANTVKVEKVLTQINKYLRQLTSNGPKKDMHQ